MVAEKFEAEPEQLCLIFAGKIMKDNDTLKSHNVKDGLTVHLVSFTLVFAVNHLTFELRNFAL
jgi:hypothetical protein